MLRYLSPPDELWTDPRYLESHLRSGYRMTIPPSGSSGTIIVVLLSAEELVLQFIGQSLLAGSMLLRLGFPIMGVSFATTLCFLLISCYTMYYRPALKRKRETHSDVVILVLGAWTDGGLGNDFLAVTMNRLHSWRTDVALSTSLDCCQENSVRTPTSHG